MLSIDTVPTTRHAAPAHEHVAVVGQRAPDAVAVADRHRADPGRRGGDEAAPVAGALPRGDRLDLGEVGHELERRREPVAAGVGAERVHAVDGDPAADQVEPRLRDPQRGGGVRGVQQQAVVARPQRLGPGQEAGELLAREGGVVVGGREVRHRPGQPQPRRRGHRGGDALRLGGVARAEPAHPAVELDVDPGRVGVGVLRERRDESPGARRRRPPAPAARRSAPPARARP